MNIIITGASDGIGLQLALLLNKPGVFLLLVGKRSATSFPVELEAHHRYISANLNSTNGIAQVAASVDSLGWDSVDMIIHNAAIGWVGQSKDQPWSNIEEILNVNCVAPIALTHCFLPHLTRANGKIVFIGSSITHRRCPSFSVYAASKATLAGFARSLRIELHDELQVQLIHPGPTNTSMHAKAGLKKSWVHKLFRQPDSVAEEIIWAIESDRGTVTLGFFRYYFGRTIHFLYSCVEHAKTHQIRKPSALGFKRAA